MNAFGLDYIYQPSNYIIIIVIIIIIFSHLLLLFQTNHLHQTC